MKLRQLIVRLRHVQGSFQVKLLDFRSACCSYLEAILRIAAFSKSILCSSNRSRVWSLVRNRVCAHRIVARYNERSASESSNLLSLILPMAAKRFCVSQRLRNRFCAAQIALACDLLFVIAFAHTESSPDTTNAVQVSLRIFYHSSYRWQRSDFAHRSVCEIDFVRNYVATAQTS